MKRPLLLALAMFLGGCGSGSYGGGTTVVHHYHTTTHCHSVTTRSFNRTTTRTVCS